MILGVGGHGVGMRIAPRLSWGLALLVLGLGAAAAGDPKGKLVSPGKLVVAGRALTCGDTPTLIRNFPGYAVSSTLIVLNLGALSSLPPVVRWMVYYHECGHIHVGASEVAADCWAVKRARREGWLTQKGLNQVCAVFNQVGHGAAHPAPEQRCDLMRQCFRGGVGRMVGGPKRSREAMTEEPAARR